MLEETDCSAQDMRLPLSAVQKPNGPAIDTKESE